MFQPPSTPVPMASSGPVSVLLELEGADSNTSSPQPEENKSCFIFKDPNFKVCLQWQEQYCPGKYLCP